MKRYLPLINKIVLTFVLVLFLLLMNSFKMKESNAYENNTYETISYSIIVSLNQKNHQNYYKWLDEYDLKEENEYDYNEKVHLHYYEKINKEIIESFDGKYGIFFNSLYAEPSIYKTEFAFNDIFDDLDFYKEIVQLDYVESINIKYTIWSTVDTGE